jgi:hypothetical protein
MAFRGDSALYGDWFSPEQDEFDMATAIARVYTPEGFVVAADGRKINHSNPSDIQDTAQKILPVQSEWVDLACSFAGAVILTDDDTNESVFDFLPETARASQELTARSCQNVFDYAGRWSKLINAQLNAAKSTGRFREYPSIRLGDQRGSTIALVYLDGFYEGIPRRLLMRFFHEDQKLYVPEVSPQKLALGRPLLYGPAPVEALLDRRDPRLTRYATPQGTAVSVESGIEICKNFVAACASPEALEIDPQCASVGGHIHIATITPDAGFKWAIPPIQAG